MGIVDVHWSGRGPAPVPDLAGVDVLLLGGDLTNFRGVEEARRLLEELTPGDKGGTPDQEGGTTGTTGEKGGTSILAVCGNCDLPEIEGYLEGEGISLDRRARAIDGVRFVGLSGGLPFGGCPYERTEDEFARACAEAFASLQKLGGSGPTILVSHQPPYDTRCDLARGRHVGSRAIRRSIEEHQPDLVLCGHIHESRGTDLIGRSRIVNPGPWMAGHSLRFRVADEAIELRS